MKILIVSTVQTHPTTSGSARFINSYSSMLKEMGHDVYFLHVPPGYRDNATIKEGIAHSRNFWGDNYFLYRTNFINAFKIKLLGWYSKYFNKYYSKCDDRYIWGLHNYVKNLNDKYHFDACLVNYYWLTKLLPRIPIRLKGLVSHDSFTYNNERNCTYNLLNLKPNEEAKALQRCPYIFAMQDEERVLFKYLAPHSKILISYCIYNFVNQSMANNHNLVLLSSAFFLNINGVLWFLENIFPEIIRNFPDCKLIIGGSICKQLSNHTGNPNIKLLGFVKDASDLYKLGDVAINPTFQGTGMKIKTFEAIAHNKITMVHPHSLSGIYHKEEAPLFASDKASEWVAFLKKVWQCPEFSIKIRENNAKYIHSLNEYVKSQFVEFLNGK